MEKYNNKESKNVLRESVQTVVDSNGEMLEERTFKTLAVSTEPNFVKVYLQDILFLSGVPTGVSAVLYGLLRYMDYENRVFINTAMKELIAEENGLKFRTVNQAITTLKNNDVLIRKSRGLYVVNPHLIAKGDWKSIRQIRREITWSAEGKKFGNIITVIEEEKNEE
jgi:hypothetical protein